MKKLLPQILREEIRFMYILGPIFLLIQITLMILLKGFLVRPIISLTKNPSRNPFNVIWMSRKIGP